MLCNRRTASRLKNRYRSHPTYAILLLIFLVSICSEKKMRFHLWIVIGYVWRMTMINRLTRWRQPYTVRGHSVWWVLFHSTMFQIECCMMWCGRCWCNFQTSQPMCIAPAGQCIHLYQAHWQTILRILFETKFERWKNVDSWWSIKLFIVCSPFIQSSDCTVQ